MKDKWLNTTFEDSTLQPFKEDLPDYNDAERIRKNPSVDYFCRSALFLSHFLLNYKAQRRLLSPPSKALRRFVEWMVQMGFSRSDIHDSLTKQRFNNITATYILLNQRRQKSLPWAPTLGGSLGVGVGTQPGGQRSLSSEMPSNNGRSSTPGRRHSTVNSVVAGTPRATLNPASTTTTASFRRTNYHHPLPPPPASQPAAVPDQGARKFSNIALESALAGGSNETYRKMNLPQTTTGEA